LEITTGHIHPKVNKFFGWIWPVSIISLEKSIVPSNADIKLLKNTKPQKYRLRIADYRIIYIVESDVVKVIELFKRGRGYRK